MSRKVTGEHIVIGQLLDQIRDYYIDYFIDTINEYGETNGGSIFHEVALCKADGSLATAGVLGLPVRGDLVVIRDSSGTDSVRIDTDGMLSFEPIEFEWPENNLVVDLGPFQWNWMQLRIFGLGNHADWEPIRDWFMGWFQEEDPEEGELLGGVHFLSDPETGNAYSQVSIDLGTAPVESFEELLDALGQMGATKVQFGLFEDYP